MKNKKGFTLIELLAVIIILGILMIIAIPSVTSYINNSRKSAYVDTAKEIIAGARNFVNEGKIEMYATDTTYYIPASCINTENGQKSPYGEFVKAYVVVNYDGNKYTYFWTSVDDAGIGIKKILKYDNMKEDEVLTDLDELDILDTAGVDGREQYVIIDENCKKGTTKTAMMYIDEDTGEKYSIPDDWAVSFRAEWEGVELHVGDTVNLIAEITGAEDYKFKYLWSYSEDNETWYDLTGEEDWFKSSDANKEKIEFEVTNTNKSYWWSVKAVVTGKKR